MYAGNGHEKYNKLCPHKKDIKSRGKRKTDFRGLDVGEGV